MAHDASQTPVLSVVAPIFNEEQTLSELVRRLAAACRPLDVPYEILIVNDGSRDRSLERLITLSRDLPQLRVLSLSRNFGPMAALHAGLFQARGRAVVTIDGDLQDPPELIPRLFARWREGARVVYAMRTERDDPGLQRLGTNLFYKLLHRASGRLVPVEAGTFGLVDRRIVELMKKMPERERFFAGLRAWVGGSQATVEYERQPRLHGESRMGLKRLSRLARLALVSFSDAPLRWASFLSLSFCLVLFGIGLYAILTRLLTNLAIPGWATTTALLGMVGAFQSLVLAILSEYISVLFAEVKARPLYVVEQEFARGSAVEPQDS